MAIYNPKSLKAEEFINHEEILDTIRYAQENKHNVALIDELLEKARPKKTDHGTFCAGLTHREASVLLACDIPEKVEQMYQLAAEIKDAFYGNRIVLFAPLYLSNYCINGCVYCPYHRVNQHITRKKLTQEEVRAEVMALQDMGHKRLAIEAGEDPVNNPIEYILECIHTIYSIHNKNGDIRRVNVNIAATTVENYRKLKDAGIGTYILFQETYNKKSYLELHPQNFYQINADVDGTQFVTARGWEDLSNLLDTYEQLGLQADEDLIREYIQHPKIAEDFSAYLDLYYKYRDDYGVEDILAGQAKPAAFARLLQAPFDEKLSLVSLILSGLETRFSASRRADAAADSCYAFLRETKKAFAEMPAELAQEPNCWAQLFDQMIADYEAEIQKKRTAGLLDKPTLEARLQTAKTLRSWEKELLRAAAPDADAAFKVLRTQFSTLSDARDTAQQTASAAMLSRL